MKRTLEEIKEAQNKLKTFSGNENNRNYWRGVLADSFPAVIEEKEGLPTIIQFMNQTFRSRKPLGLNAHPITLKSIFLAMTYAARKEGVTLDQKYYDLEDLINEENDISLTDMIDNIENVYSLIKEQEEE